MKAKILTSTLVIVFVLVLTLGATFAWFTDEQVINDNTFTAGTVYLNADEQWYHEDGLEDWNPGDCTPKFISIEYGGTKRAFLRMQVDQGWYDNKEDENPNDLSTDNIKWWVYKGEGSIDDIYNEEDGTWILPNGIATFKDWVESEPDDWEEFDLGDDDNWVYDNGWYYYAGGTDEEFSFDLNGEIIKAIKEGDDVWGEPLYLVSAVCLDGPETGNEYQGKTYKMGFTFQAIQASHSDQWDWDDINFETGLPSN